MNYKILMKSINFMFIPTLAVLCVLLVGFFDPIAMWNFIKSDSGWAITIRVILFIVEISVVAFMYNHYSDEEEKKQLINEATSGNLEGKETEISYDKCTYRNFDDYSTKFSFHTITTKDPNILIIKRKPKAN